MLNTLRLTVLASGRAKRMRSEEHRLNSSHSSISYAVFCLKKKKTQQSEKTSTTKHNQKQQEEIGANNHSNSQNLDEIYFALHSHLEHVNAEDYLLFTMRPPPKITLFRYTTLSR